MSKTSIVTAGLLLTLGTATAIAGPCTDEITRLTQQMSAHDAGSGPTPGATAQGTTGSTTGQAGTQAQHPPTATMSRETEGKAASPQDVQRQTMGQPPAAQQGQTGGQGMAGQQSATTDALNRARTLDQQGNEAGCMNAIDEAKRLQR